jgi:hypothetical protein
MSYFVIGYNMPGYLPEMEPYAVETADEAKRALIDELERHADQVADGGDEDGATDLSHLAEDLNLSDVSGGWGANAGGLVYWIEQTPGDMPEDGDL